MLGVRSEHCRDLIRRGVRAVCGGGLVFIHLDRLCRLRKVMHPFHLDLPPCLSVLSKRCGWWWPRSSQAVCRSDDRRLDRVRPVIAPGRWHNTGFAAPVCLFFFLCDVSVAGFVMLARRKPDRSMMDLVSSPDPHLRARARAFLIFLSFIFKRKKRNGCLFVRRCLYRHRCPQTSTG
jgi:hypothetical protein